MSERTPNASAGRAAIAIALGALGLVGCALPGALRFQRAIEREGTIERTLGEGLRDLARSCDLCHGHDGNGASQYYPRLAGQPAAYLEAQLDAFAAGTRGAPQMQPLALSLTPDERRAISTYYASFAAAPNTGLAPAPSDPRAAELSRACTACHGSSFEGAEMPVRAPRLAGQGQEYLARQLVAFRSGARVDPAGTMSAIARSLGDREIETLADHLARR
ncbi:cytochrome subunit of sulfide dehydrogenase [Myxococcaceae bacterium]|jgi:cytochrome c553|nr:cytochrome subunit of sulfide dehydrogenase [Myxococcaceae bacterium]